MKIELKKKNIPVTPGFYLYKNLGDYMPRMADIRLMPNGLEVVFNGGCYPLAKCEKTVLWSDKIEIAERKIEVEK